MNAWHLRMLPLKGSIVARDRATGLAMRLPRSHYRTTFIRVSVSMRAHSRRGYSRGRRGRRSGDSARDTI